MHCTCVKGAQELTIAPDDLDETTAFIKRPALSCYKTMKGTPFIPREVLSKALTMEKIAKARHPHIIHYLGCRVRRKYLLIFKSPSKQSFLRDGKRKVQVPRYVGG